MNRGIPDIGQQQIMLKKNKIIAKVLFKYFNDKEKKFTWDTM